MVSCARRVSRSRKLYRQHLVEDAQPVSVKDGGDIALLVPPSLQGRSDYRKIGYRLNTTGSALYPLAAIKVGSQPNMARVAGNLAHDVYRLSDQIHGDVLPRSLAPVGDQCPVYWHNADDTIAL